MHRRFDRAGRLLGEDRIDRLSRSHVAVFGVGGVGSFAAEALIRTGVGRLTLIDYDRICVTNVNRQLHALKGTLGKSKVEIMAERLRQINPDATIETRAEFYNEKNSQTMLTPEPDVVIDAIDNMTAKVHLLATCLRERIRVVACMGAAAKLDPTLVRLADVSETKVCPLARHVRRLLKKTYGIDTQRHVGLPVVYSEESPIAPQWLSYDDGAFRCVCPGGTNGFNDCDHRHRIEGSVAYVTSVFGMVAANAAVRLLNDMPLHGERGAGTTRAERMADQAARRSEADGPTALHDVDEPGPATGPASCDDHAHSCGHGHIHDPSRGHEHSHIH